MFAPTNYAFDALNDDDDAFNNTRIEDVTDTDLKNFIRFHLVPGVKLYREDFSCFSTLYTMANGEDSRLLCKDEGIDGYGPYGIKGSGNNKTSPPKFTSEIKACNGVIHPIDQVLLYETKDQRKEKEQKDKNEDKKTE
jgi:uncharacterized surface protein with fasciclin (FAS1) repeats